MRGGVRPLLVLLLCAAALCWAVPFAWMGVASLRPGGAGAADIASLIPAGPFSLMNFTEAWNSGHFPLWYLNTMLLCGGILAVQCITISLAGYAFARLRFRGRETLFYLFLLQLMLVPPILIVPNMTTLVALHLYDTLPGVMAPYFASALPFPHRLRNASRSRSSRYSSPTVVWFARGPPARTVASVRPTSAS